MADSPVFCTECDLARTFDGGYYDDAWQIVKEYQKATAYASKHDVGSGATASALDLPRSRLRTWIDDGGKPDPVRAIDTARSHGWIDLAYPDREFAGLNALVANVFSGGSIAEQYFQPSFSLNHLGEDSHVLIAFKVLDLEYELYHVDDDRRSTEVRPADSATILGRVLSVLGAPVGPKAHQRIELPSYLDDAPEDVKRLFVVCYLENRAIGYEEKATLRVLEDRNRSYLDSLANLIQDVTGERVTSGDRGITISAAAARELGTVR